MTDEIGSEPVEFQAQPGGIGDQVIEAEVVLVGQQDVVHLPELALGGGVLGGLGG
ncbi:MAG: hypothetical protein ACRDQ5_26400 [Sciscionella sp.]